MPPGTTPPERRHDRDSRDLFLYWWPVTARLAGLAIASYEMLAEGANSPSVLAFAGALIVAPNIFESQKRRNAQRDREEDQ